MEPNNIIKGKRSLHKNATFEDYGIGPESQKEQDARSFSAAQGGTQSTAGSDSAGSTESTQSTAGSNSGQNTGGTQSAAGADSGKSTESTQSTAGTDSRNSTGSSTQTGKTAGAQPKPKKKGSCLGRIIRWLLVFALTYVIGRGVVWFQEHPGTFPDGIMEYVETLKEDLNIPDFGGKISSGSSSSGSSSTGNSSSGSHSESLFDFFDD